MHVVIISPLLVADLICYSILLIQAFYRVPVGLLYLNQMSGADSPVHGYVNFSSILPQSEALLVYVVVCF